MFEVPQIELPSVTTLMHRDDAVFMPYELKPTVRPQFDVLVAKEFSSALTQAESDVPTARVPTTHVPTDSGAAPEFTLASDQPAVDHLAVEQSTVDEFTGFLAADDRSLDYQGTDDRGNVETSTLSESAQSNRVEIEEFANAFVQTPADMSQLVDSPQLADIDFDTDVNEQMAELQMLEPSPPVAKQVIESDLADLANNTKASQPWPSDFELERDQLQEREQQLLDEMIEDFEHSALESQSQSESRPIYRPEFDPSAEPIDPIEEPIAPQPIEIEQPPAEPEAPLPGPLEPQRPEPTPPQQPEDSKNIAVQSDWPRPTALFKSLDKLSPVYGVEDWSAQVRVQLARLEQVQHVSDPASLDVFEKLGRLVDQSAPISLQLASRSQQVAMRQSAYALSRRLDVWKASYQASQAHHEALPHEVYHSVEPVQMQQRVSDARRGLTRFQNSESWVDYLLLDKLDESARGRGPFVGAARAELATIALDRLTDPNLSKQEMAFLKSLGLEELGQELRLWATHPVSQADMLASLERFELEPTNPIKSDRLANYRKDLYWSAVPSQNNVAAALDKHYRNANVRVSVNQSMINRLVPAVRELRQPVRDNILGAQVKGQSRSRAQVFVRLLPDRSRLRFMFENTWRDGSANSGDKRPCDALEPKQVTLSSSQSGRDGPVWCSLWPFSGGGRRQIKTPRHANQVRQLPNSRVHCAQRGPTPAQPIRRACSKHFLSTASNNRRASKSTAKSSTS